MIEIDDTWLREHPLPAHDADTDKNQRGRVLAVGGSRIVPGALRLTGEAALRAGAGKVQMATVEEAALLLGLTVPEAAVVALPSGPDGEIDVAGAVGVLKQWIGSCDTLVLGPGMTAGPDGARLVSALLQGLGRASAAVLDAGAIAACADCGAAVRALSGRAVLTPHAGEMAALTGRDADYVQNNAAMLAAETAALLGSVLVLKGAETVIAAPAGDVLIYRGGGPELATGGSGDVLAGILAGLLARGADPIVAAAWAVWVHGEAGAAIATRLGGPGLLARELLALIPELLHGAKKVAAT